LTNSAKLHGTLRDDQPRRASLRFCAVPTLNVGVTRQVPWTTESLLERLRRNPDTGIAAIHDRSQIAAAGGNTEAEFMVRFKLGYEMGSDPKAPMVSPSVDRGMHGYSPALSQMNSTFLLLGSGVPAGRALGEIDMRDIAPTLARLLAIKLPGAEGKPVI